jgi:hypothetical protein
MVVSGIAGGNAHNIRPHDLIADPVVVDVKPSIVGKFLGKLISHRLRVRLRINYRGILGAHLDDPVFDIALGIHEPRPMIVPEALECEWA